MAITNAEATRLNTANVANQKVALGTIVQGLQAAAGGSAGTAFKYGKVTVSAAQATATQADITTGLAAITGWIVQVYRAGVMVLEDGVVSTPSAGVLRVKNGTTLTLANGDLVMYWVF